MIGSFVIFTDINVHRPEMYDHKVYSYNVFPNCDFAVCAFNTTCSLCQTIYYIVFLNHRCLNHKSLNLCFKVSDSVHVGLFVF